MAAVNITNNFLNGPDSVAADVNQNFTDLTTFLNASVLHRDGTKVPTASLGLGGSKVTGLAEPTATGDAATKSYVSAYSAAGRWTGTTLTAAAGTDTAFSTELADPLGWANLGVSTTTFTCPEDGMYQIQLSWDWTSSTGATLRINGSAVTTQVGNTYYVSGSTYYMEYIWYYYFTAGEYFKIRGTAGSDLTGSVLDLSILKVAD